MKMHERERKNMHVFSLSCIFIYADMERRYGTPMWNADIERRYGTPMRSADEADRGHPAGDLIITIERPNGIRYFCP